MTVVAVAAAADDRADHGPDRSLPGTSFVDTLVARLHAEFGADPDEIRGRAVAALARFADARVQAFVPILVEKSLRDTYRRAVR